MTSHRVIRGDALRNAEKSPFRETALNNRKAGHQVTVLSGCPRSRALTSEDLFSVARGHDAPRARMMAHGQNRSFRSGLG